MNCFSLGSNSFYLFKRSDNNDAQHWRSDGGKWHNNARVDMPKGNPVVTKEISTLRQSNASTRNFFEMNSSLVIFLLLTLYLEWKSVSTIGCDQQNNNRDCGPFSIANATVLAFKGDPGTVRGVSTDRRCLPAYIALRYLYGHVKLDCFSY